MKKQKILSFFSTYILLLFSQNIQAQSTEYLTKIHAYVGGSFDPYTIEDPGGKLNDAPVGSFSAGLEVDVEYSDVFAVGGGLIYKTYAETVDFVGSNLGGISPTMETIQIPVYLRARTYFHKGKAQAYILGGGAWAINLNYNSGIGRSYGSVTANGENISYMSETDDSLKKSFPLLMAGGGVDFPLPVLKTESKYFRFGFSARRFFGFSKVMQVDVDYDIDNARFFSASEIYKGGHWMFNIHLIVAL